MFGPGDTLLLHRLCLEQYECTALMMAAKGGFHECLSMLLAHGAKVDKLNEVSFVLGSVFQGKWC